MKNIVKTYTRIAFLRKYYLLNGAYCQRVDTTDYYLYRFQRDRVQVKQVVSKEILQGIALYLEKSPDYVLDKPNKKIYLDTTPELFARYEIFFLELIRRHFHELISELNGVPLHNPAVGLYESFLRALN